MARILSHNFYRASADVSQASPFAFQVSSRPTMFLTSFGPLIQIVSFIVEIRACRLADEDSLRTALPLASTQAQQSPIYNVIYIRGPSFNASGEYLREAAPTFVMSTAGNGRTVVTDLNDVSAGGAEDSSSMIRISRGEPHSFRSHLGWILMYFEPNQGTSTRALAFSATLGSPVLGDLDYQAYAVRVRALGYSRESKLVTHQGMIWVSPSRLRSQSAIKAQLFFVIIFQGSCLF